ncbi:MAG: hypothetical protein ABL962_12985 [Fimbriimonadaceae bacterium]
MKINTPQGAIEIAEPDPVQLQNLRQALPFGLVGYQSPVHGAEYGIVLQCGGDEAWVVKQQEPDVPEERFPEVYLSQSILIASSVARYRAAGFGGCFMPCVYFRKKESGMETGIAYFGSPSPLGIEADPSASRGAFDSDFGRGFTTMFNRFIEELQQSSKESGIKLQPCIGLEARPISVAGTLIFGFLVHGQDVYCLKPGVSDKDPAWTALRSSGIDRIFDLPSIPARITDEQLGIAKPEAAI